MAGKGIIDTLFVFRLLRKLTMKYEKWDAFKSGVIDKNGNILVKKKERDKKQKDSFNMLDRLAWNLKRLIGKVPGGKSQVASYVAALALIKEYTIREKGEATSEYLSERLEEHGLVSKRDYDLSNAEGYWNAMLDAMEEGTVSGASFGGPLSGAGTNAVVNAGGLAGMDSLLGGGTKDPKKKKKKDSLEKILDQL
tara:strand:+ start:167 stop:751 length:585 start_codon:yes stop_codon:yes gene_type:complete